MKTVTERHGVGFERDWVTYYSQRPKVYPGKPPSAVLQITFQHLYFGITANYIMKMKRHPVQVNFKQPSNIE